MGSYFINISRKPVRLKGAYQHGNYTKVIAYILIVRRLIIYPYHFFACCLLMSADGEDCVAMVLGGLRT